MIRLLHLGDLHLGSTFSLFSRAEAARWREAQFFALEELLSDAVRRGAQVLLFAGDVFDTPFPAREDAKRFFGILEKTGLPALITPGNHDFLTPAGVWGADGMPSCVCLFTSEKLAYFDFPELGLTVYGYAFTGESAAAPPLGTAVDRMSDRVSVLLAHADLASPLSPYAPLPAGALTESGFAYAALGHIHNPPLPKCFGRTVAAYSGFFAGRGFDELGAGRALFVTLGSLSERGAAIAAPEPTADGVYSFPGTSVTIAPVAVSAPSFCVAKLDCTGDVDGEDVRRRVEAFLREDSCRGVGALRLCLCGEVGLSCVPRPEAIGRLGSSFSYFECRDETLPVLGAEYLEKDLTLRGAFYRALLPKLHSADAQTRQTAAQALRIGLAALAGREV